MNKKNLLKKKRSLLVALGSSLVLASPVNASRGEDIENKINNFFQPFVDIDDAINDKLDEFKDSDVYETIKDGAGELSNSAHSYLDKTIDYDIDTLNIVTFKPNSNPNEEREYYFVNSLVPGLPKIYYLDEEGNEVNKKSENKRFKVKVKIHHTITEDTNGSKYNFEEKTYEDLVTNETWSNVVDLSNEEYYLTNNSDLIEFGIFSDIKDVLPQDLIKDEYTLSEVKELTEYINDVNNDLAFSNDLNLKR